MLQLPSCDRWTDTIHWGLLAPTRLVPKSSSFAWFWFRLNHQDVCCSFDAVGLNWNWRLMKNVQVRCRHEARNTCPNDLSPSSLPWPPQSHFQNLYANHTPIMRSGVALSKLQCKNCYGSRISSRSQKAFMRQLVWCFYHDWKRFVNWDQTRVSS